MELGSLTVHTRAVLLLENSCPLPLVHESLCPSPASHLPVISLLLKTISSLQEPKPVFLLTLAGGLAVV